MEINQRVTVKNGLERGHTATIIAIGTEDEGRENQVRIRFDKKPGAATKWADKWINVKHLERVYATQPPVAQAVELATGQPEPGIDYVDESGTQRRTRSFAKFFPEL